MKKFLLYLWQLPQNLLGELLLLFYQPEETYDFKPYKHESNYLVKLHYSSRMKSGISLGRHIIVSSAFVGFKGTAEEHEYGHCLQSLRLGWLYLIVIGLPSLLGNIWDRIAHRGWSYADSNKWYYSQPWEAWADKLGGVER